MDEILEIERRPPVPYTSGTWKPMGNARGIDSWRQTPELTEAFADLRELIDGAEVHVLNAVFETARTA